MTKHEVIDAIHYLYFKQKEEEIGNLKLESYYEEGDWQIVVFPVGDEDWENARLYCYYYYSPDDFQVNTPEQMYNWIANDFDWKF